MPKVLILTIEPALMDFRCECVDTIDLPMRGNISTTQVKKLNLEIYILVHLYHGCQVEGIPWKETTETHIQEDFCWRYWKLWVLILYEVTHTHDSSIVLKKVVWPWNYSSHTHMESCQKGVNRKKRRKVLVRMERADIIVFFVGQHPLELVWSSSIWVEY